MNPGSRDLGRALDLDIEEEDKLTIIIGQALRDIAHQKGNNGNIAFDNLIKSVCHHLQTPEQAFYSAVTIVAYLQAAKDTIDITL